MMSTMSKEERTSLQSDLAAALAAGKSCAEWASANGVSERTAQRWASEPEVRAEVEAYRRGNLDQAVGLYENTKLGRHEIYAEFLETTDGVWFTGFDPARHVSIDAEYHPSYFVRCAIDAGTSRHTAAVFFQVRSDPCSDRPQVTVFADYHAQDVVSLKNACAIKSLADQLPCRGRIDQVRVDPAATARSSLGPAAYSEYERVFGSRIIARWPQHLVLDGLDTIEGLLDTGNLLIHPRCTHLRDAFRNYCRRRRGGEWIDFPADGHPEEDLMDAPPRRHS